MPTRLEEVNGKIEAKTNRLDSLFKKKLPSGDYDLTVAEIDEIKTLNRELNEELGPERDTLLALAKIEKETASAVKDRGAVHKVPKPGGGGGAGGHDGQFVLQSGGLLDMYGRPAVKTIGELFTEHDNYKSFTDGRSPVSLADYDVKTLFQTSAGWDPFVTRRPGYVPSAQQQPRIADLLPAMQTSQHSIKWMLETTYTSGAAETAEGGSYGESTFELTEQTSPVQKIAATIPMTDEQVADEPGARDYLNNRVTLQLRQRFDSQILNGNGTSPNLKGLLNVSGIQTYAKAAEDNDFDTVMQAINKVRVTAFAEPNAIIMHPTDWMKLLLIRVNGIYVMGYPGQESAPRLWGLPVVTTTYKGSGSALVADFANFVEIWYRLGIVFSYTNSHASEFTSGIQRMRAEMRAGLVVTRPAALCTATGLTGA